MLYKFVHTVQIPMGAPQGIINDGIFPAGAVMDQANIPPTHFAGWLSAGLIVPAPAGAVATITPAVKTPPAQATRPAPPATHIPTQAEIAAEEEKLAADLAAAQHAGS